MEPLTPIPEVNEDYSRSSSTSNPQPSSSSYKTAETSFSDNSEYFDAEEKFKDFEENIPEFPMDKINSELSMMYGKVMENIVNSFKYIDELSKNDKKRETSRSKGKKRETSRSKGKKGGNMKASRQAIMRGGMEAVRPEAQVEDRGEDIIGQFALPSVDSEVARDLKSEQAELAKEAVPDLWEPEEQFKDDKEKATNEEFAAKIEVLEEAIGIVNGQLTKISETQDEHGEILQSVKDMATKVLSGTTKILTDTTNIQKQNEKLRQNIEKMHTEMSESFAKILDDGDENDNCPPMKLIRYMFKNNPNLFNRIVHIITSVLNIVIFVSSTKALTGGASDGPPDLLDRVKAACPDELAACQALSTCAEELDTAIGGTHVDLDTSTAEFAALVKCSEALDASEGKEEIKRAHEASRALIDRLQREPLLALQLEFEEGARRRRDTENQKKEQREVRNVVTRLVTEVENQKKEEQQAAATKLQAVQRGNMARARTAARRAAEKEKMKKEKFKNAKNCIYKTTIFLLKVFLKVSWNIHEYSHNKAVLLTSSLLDILKSTFGKIPLIGTFVLFACKSSYYMFRFTYVLLHMVIIMTMVHIPAMVIQYFFGTQYKFPEYVFILEGIKNIYRLLSFFSEYISSQYHFLAKELYKLFGPRTSYLPIKFINQVLSITFGKLFNIKSVGDMVIGLKELWFSVITWSLGDIIPGLTGVMAEQENFIVPDNIAKFKAEDGGFIDVFFKHEPVKTFGRITGWGEIPISLKEFRKKMIEKYKDDGGNHGMPVYDVDANLPFLPIWQRATLDSALNPPSQEPVPLYTPLTINTPMTNLTHSTTPSILHPRTPNIMEVLKEVKKDKISKLSGESLRNEAKKYNINTGGYFTGNRDEQDLKKELISKVDDGTIPVGGGSKRRNKRNNRKRTNRKRTNRRRTNRKRTNRRRTNRKRTNRRRTNRRRTNRKRTNRKRTNRKI